MKCCFRPQYAYLYLTRENLPSSESERTMLSVRAKEITNVVLNTEPCEDVRKLSAWYASKDSGHRDVIKGLLKNPEWKQWWPEERQRQQQQQPAREEGVRRRSRRGSIRRELLRAYWREGHGGGAAARRAAAAAPAGTLSRPSGGFIGAVKSLLEEFEDLTRPPAVPPSPGEYLAKAKKLVLSIDGLLMYEVGAGHVATVVTADGATPEPAAASSSTAVLPCVPEPGLSSSPPPTPSGGGGGGGSVVWPLPLPAEPQVVPVRDDVDDDDDDDDDALMCEDNYDQGPPYEVATPTTGGGSGIDRAAGPPFEVAPPTTSGGGSGSGRATDKKKTTTTKAAQKKKKKKQTSFVLLSSSSEEEDDDEDEEEWDWASSDSGSNSGSEENDMDQ